MYAARTDGTLTLQVVVWLMDVDAVIAMGLFTSAAFLLSSFLMYGLKGDKT